MAHIKPSRPKYDPANDLTEEGQFLAECHDVRYGLTNKMFPNGKPNMAIEFRIDDPDYPHLRGRLVAIVCTESVYRDPVTRRESNLVTHARLMGVKNPEAGFDPDVFRGRWYRVQVESHDGRCFVRAAMPAGRPPHAGKPEANGTTPPPPDAGDAGEVPF